MSSILTAAKIDLLDLTQGAVLKVLSNGKHGEIAENAERQLDFLEPLCEDMRIVDIVLNHC